LRIGSNTGSIALTRNDDSFIVDLIDRLSQVDFDAKLFQVLLCGLGEIRCECTENLWSGIGQNNSG